MHPVPLRSLGGYREHPVPAALREVAAAAWTYVRREGSGTADAPPPRHRVLPETGVSLCFRCRRARDGTVLGGELLLMGPIDSVHIFEPAEGERLEAVRLDRALSRDLLRVAPEEHLDGLAPLAAAAPGLARRLLPRLAVTRSSRDATAALLAEVGALRHARDPSPDARLARAALALMRMPAAGARVGPVARELGVSERHLRRAVRAATGAAPKWLQRVDRLNRLMAAADATPRPRWARLAVELGFADQSHLAQEVASLTGLPPARLHAERRIQQAVVEA